MNTNNADGNEDDFLEGSAEEKLRMDNELLKLKMQAELGALFQQENEIPAELENAFLKNILAFHKAADAQKRITVFEKLEKPKFTKAINLNNLEIEVALIELEALLASKHIILDFLEEYNSRIKYTFITEELFIEEMDDMDLGEMNTHFIYEDFHPNHEADIKRQAENFINLWFNKSISSETLELANEFILPEGKTKTKEDIVAHIQNIFSLSNGFINGRYDIIDVDFKLMDGDRGMGYAEGALGYRVILANGETEITSGPFKLYFALEFGYWQIVHLVFPGFSY